MKTKKHGFTLIELLVVIVIIGILSTISTATFKSYFGKARDAERQAAVQNIALMMKVDNASISDDSKYVYKGGNDGNVDGSLKQLFDENDFRMPKGSNNICYHIGGSQGIDTHLGDDNNFYVATWGETTSTVEPGTTGVLVDGTEACVSKISSIGQASGTPTKLDSKFDPIDFDCIPSVTGNDLRKDPITGLKYVLGQPKKYINSNLDGELN